MAFPVGKFMRSTVLEGRSNGRLPDSILVNIPGQDRGPLVRLVPPAARAWVALCAAARSAGHVLKASGPADSFRPYSVQERIFRDRYTTQRLEGRPSKQWNGQTWWQRPGTAVAAVPGTSNHGWASAVDTGVERDGDPSAESIDQAALGWLRVHAVEFGWSWEVQSEPWHLRYNPGDQIPAAVLAYEANQEELTVAQIEDILKRLGTIESKVDRVLTAGKPRIVQYATPIHKDPAGVERETAVYVVYPDGRAKYVPYGPLLDHLFSFELYEAVGFDGNPIGPENQAAVEFIDGPLGQ